ncbi:MULTISPECIES: magnesium and cobalt transport protein CorA [unclassified Rhizobium]|uniref:magnesium and cobalt transport protein CorA n=1 Tax=unclassified Rhizobium TaxID=2613769 RepID=UPI00071327D1|nr:MULTISPECIES: magnesium and cobalt transport protein CorA [unclassified Rhizobium]KQT01746.1 magnesium transporter [Rhizobium sp. Leaf391]KQT06824.1 magnesium transporter [Rhizobium sp. Leaf386]KQU06138.1 magnesium transporter [Rhizobium sp. Leaf453]
MTVIASYMYRRGKRAEEVPLTDQPFKGEDGEFVWIGLSEPTEAEMQNIQKMFNLHRLAVEDALNGKQVPKVDVYGDQLFVVAKTAHLDGEKIAYGETCIFVGRDHLISVRHGSARSHSDLRQQLEQSPQLLEHGPDYVLHGIIDFIVDGYLPMVETIEDKVLEMEKHVLVSLLQPEQIRRIFRMRRQVIRFQRVLGPMGEVVGKLSHLEFPCVDNSAKPFFKDVHDHIRRVEGLVNGLREIMTSVFEASNLLEQQRQGTITRQLASWAAILAVPTAIAGIYGMNFQNMPELSSRYGYFVVLGTIMVLCSLLYLRFKKSGWL